MTKAQAISAVVESAKFWRAEDLRLQCDLEELTDIDSVTCADSECAMARLVLGDTEFLKVFNDVYMAE